MRMDPWSPLPWPCARWPLAPLVPGPWASRLQYSRGSHIAPEHMVHISGVGGSRQGLVKLFKTVAPYIAHTSRISPQYLRGISQHLISYLTLYLTSDFAAESSPPTVQHFGPRVPRFQMAPTSAGPHAHGPLATGSLALCAMASGPLGSWSLGQSSTVFAGLPYSS